MRDDSDRLPASGGDARALSDRLVAGRYRLAHELGHGGMGVVWLAHDTQLDREVALKELRPPGLGAADREVFRLRAQQEARAAARVRHPSAVTLYDVLSDAGDGAVYLIMELIHGPTLAELVQRDGALPAPRAAGIGLQLLDVLEAAHALGVVHRDVKPGNILIAANDHVKLTDFGIAHIAGDPRLTRSGIIGTPAYQAPELFESASITPAADMWSLGATLYYAADGRGPFDRDSTGATLRAILLDDLPAPACEAHLASVIGQLLQRDPAERATIGLARADLHQVPAQASLPSADPGQKPRWNPDEETRLRPDAPAPPDTGPQTQGKHRPGRRRLLRLAIVIAAVTAVAIGGTVGILSAVSGPGTPGTLHRLHHDHHRLPPATTAGSAKSPLSENADGQSVAFVNSRQQILYDHYASGWHGPKVLPGSSRADSPIVLSSYGNVFFIEPDGQVVNDYLIKSGWAGPGPIGGNAEAGSGLAFFQGNGPKSHPAVVFVNARGRLAYDYFASSWRGPKVLPGQPRADSPLVISPNGHKVFFIERSGRVAADSSVSGWKGPARIGGFAQARSGLAFSPGSRSAGTRPAVVFVSASGKLVYDHYASRWRGPAVLPGTPRAGSPVTWSGDGTSVYFIESGGQVATDYISGSRWQGAYLTGGIASRDSGLTYAPGNGTAAGRPNVMFVAEDGRLAYDRYASRWHGPGPLPSTRR
jgi:serine/threonine protein kinase